MGINWLNALDMWTENWQDIYCTDIGPTPVGQYLIFFQHYNCRSCTGIQAPVSVSTWWRHQMETFSAFSVPGEFPAQRPVTRSFDVFFDLRLNKRLSKPWGWWFETPVWSLWRHRNDCLHRCVSTKQCTPVGDSAVVTTMRVQYLKSFRHSLHIGSPRTRIKIYTKCYCNDENMVQICFWE